MQKYQKYHAKKSRCKYGHTHDSKREAVRCDQLHLWQAAGLISELEIQVRFELLPATRYPGMLSERRLEYIADFVYNESGKKVIEDSKGMKTKDYIIKRKLMKYKYCRDGDVIFRES